MHWKMLRPSRAPAKTLQNADFVDPMAKIWEGLHREILERIVRGLLIEDFLAFGSVCSSWHSVADRKLSYKETTIPWPMLLTARAKQGIERPRFCKLSNGKIHHVFLPDARGKKCLSSRGWIIAQRNKNWFFRRNSPIISSDTYKSIETKYV